MAKAGLGVSIKGIITPKKVEEQEEKSGGVNNADLPKDAFTQEQLETCWKNFAELIRGRNRESFYSTLIIRQPEISSPNEVKYRIDNAVQRKDFERDQSELLEFLRKSLNNFSITLSLEINKTQEKSNFYTDGDKLQAMAERNPVVKDLVKRLGLDTEF